MNNSIVVYGDASDPFADLPPMDPLDSKKEELATHLTALMLHCGQTRTSMADRLDWKKSRITEVLSGRGNPTLKTVYEFASALGYDFDWVFRDAHSARKAQQPWEPCTARSHVVVSEPVKSSWSFVLHTPQEIARDLDGGTAHDFYFTAQFSQQHMAAPEHLPIAAESHVASSFWMQASDLIESHQIIQDEHV